jgi:hypothetical protein
MKTSEAPIVHMQELLALRSSHIIAGISVWHCPTVAGGRLLNLLLNFSAIVLGVTLFMITWEQGPLCIAALTCRVMEAVHTESAIFFALGSTLLLLLPMSDDPTVLAWLVWFHRFCWWRPFPCNSPIVRWIYELFGIDHLDCVAANVRRSSGILAWLIIKGIAVPDLCNLIN